MLWKYFQNRMYSFRENWEINLTICHTVPRLNPQLSTISVKSKVMFQCRSEITWPTVYSFVAWFPFVFIRKGKDDWFLHEGLLLDWLIFFLYCLQFVCQGNKFFILKSVSSFPKSVCPEAIQNFCFCNAI